MKNLVIGLLAHVDAGKTTLAEAILYKSGAIKNLGRVDYKNTLLDNYILERNRGITIFSKQAIMPYKNNSFTILDTPGHIDFSTEMERTLQILDYAILVISGTEGIQSHSETLWKLLEQYNIPTFIYINKMDLVTFSKDEILEKIKSGFNTNCIDFDKKGSYEFYENVASCSENLIEQFLTTEKIDDTSISTLIQNRTIFPCYFGSALKLDNIENFIDEINLYTQQNKLKDLFGAKVFKITRDEQNIKLVHFKITSGCLKVKDVITNVNANGENITSKINQIRLYNGEKYTQLDLATQGMVVCVTGLNDVNAGDGIGIEAIATNPTIKPILKYKVNFSKEEHPNVMFAKLKILQEEDPQLHITWDEHLQEIHVDIMGEIQKEIFVHMVKERFDVNITLTEGSILYKETITNTVIGRGHFEPLRHYAEVHFLLEPSKVGSGLIFKNTCSQDVLSNTWQKLILSYIKDKVHLGVLTGSPLTDCKITLITGKSHKKHTETTDFMQASSRAIRQGLKKADSVLLEPWYSFVLEIPTEFTGRAMTDLTQMNSEFSSPEINGELSIIKGIAPVLLMQDYNLKMNNYTKGKGRINYTVSGYYPCHNSEDVIQNKAYNSDSDINNIADSIFCANGSGYSVKWNEADDYMHLESYLPNEKQELTPISITRQIQRTKDNILLDKELMAIFEKTYGPIKRDVKSALETKKSPIIDKPFVNQNIQAKENYLLVDGYNVIFAWDNLKKLSETSLEFARDELIRILSNYQGFIKCKIIIVFDAYKVKGNKGEIETFDNITVVYTKEAETADMYIEKVTKELGKLYNVRVATSDNVEQIIVLGHGALRLSARALQEEVLQVEKAIKEFLE